MYSNVPLLADISKEAPPRCPPAVQGQAIAAGHSNVHAITAEGCVREGPVGGQVGRGQAQVNDAQVGRLRQRAGLPGRPGRRVWEGWAQSVIAIGHHQKPVVSLHAQHNDALPYRLSRQGWFCVTLPPLRPRDARLGTGQTHQVWCLVTIYTSGRGLLVCSQASSVKGVSDLQDVDL